MLTHFKTLLTIFLLLILFSCQFSKPLISYRYDHTFEYYKDSIITKESKNYKFLAIRKHGLVGIYKNKKEYHQNGSLKKVTKMKMIPFKIQDPPMNSIRFKKEILYFNNGKVSKIKYEKIRTKESGDIKVLDEREIKYDSLGHKIE